MTTFKAAACAIALCGASVAAAVVPVNDDSDEQAIAVRRAQAPTGLFAGSLRLGVSVRDLEDADAKSAKSGVSTGAVVDEVFDQSAAEAGGVRTGDIIVEFDGERVRSARPSSFEMASA